jgi:hypothetical protein
MSGPRLRVIDGGRQGRRRPARFADQLAALADYLFPYYGRPHEEWPPPEEWPVPPRLRLVQ